MSRATILHTQISGTGKPIVLLHGYLSSSHYFKHIVERLENDHTVIAIDLLGFGKSPKPRAHYTYEDHLMALKTTLDHYNVATPYTLLGHSMGALIALKYATKFGDDVSTLLLFNPPLFTDVTQMIEAHKSSGRHYRAFLYSPARHSYWKALKVIPHNATKKRPAINFADIVRMSKHAREGSYNHIIGGADVFSDLRKTTMPTLLVNGRYDRAVYGENLKSRDLPSNVRLETIETGHHPLVKNVDIGEQLIRSHAT
jgi:pimeloyl-ACP methyl ester carboxylesterase